MNNTKKNLNIPYVKNATILLGIAIFLFIIKETIWIIATHGPRETILSAFVYILSAVLIIIYAVKGFQQKKFSILLIIGCVLLLLIEIIFLFRYFRAGGYTTAEFVTQLIAFASAFLYVIIAVIAKPKKGIIATILLSILVAIVSFQGIEVLVWMVRYGIEDGLSLIYELASCFCYPVFYFALAMFIPKAIVKPKIKKVETRNEFEKVSLMLQSLKSEYEKGNISQEYYDTKRAELLKKL